MNDTLTPGPCPKCALNYRNALVEAAGIVRLLMLEATASRTSSEFHTFKKSQDALLDRWEVLENQAKEAAV